MKSRRVPVDFAHVINPFKCCAENPSYLHYAQPITFRSMDQAAIEAGRQGIRVRLYSINYPQDDDIVPDYFIRLPHLKRSTRTEYPDITQRELPFVHEILQSVYDRSSARFLVFTNSDIGLQKTFYLKAMDLVNHGLDAFVINRRDDLPKFMNGHRLTENDLELIYSQPGKSHGGFDCFVFRRDLVPGLETGNLFTGFPPWGNLLKQELAKKSDDFEVFTNLHETFHIGRDQAWKSENKHPLWIQNIHNARKIGYNYKI